MQARAFQRNAMTSQLLMCNRPIRRTIFRQEPDPICVQRFDDSHYISQLAVFFINARTLKITAESCLSVPVIQTQLAFEIANGQQTSFMAETDLNQRKLASTLK